MPRKKILLAIFVCLLIAGFFVFDLGRFFELEYLKSQQAWIEVFYRDHPWLAALLYCSIYIAVTALSLPGAAVMTLAGGALFGLFYGTVLTSFASVIGATIAFLVARFVMRDSVQKRLGSRLTVIDKGIEEDGAWYLLTLRLVPVFPFFVVNLLMGLTQIRTWTYFWVSQVGMLPGTIVYVNAGTQLAKIDSLSGILSPGLLLSFVLLGLFPIITKKSLALFKGQRSAAVTNGESS